MEADGNKRRGISVVDGSALVLGAAVASVHLRGLELRSMTPFGWGMIWVTFCGVAITASGPFIYLARRLGRPQPGYPRKCDWMWVVLGIPWIVSTILPSAGASLNRSRSQPPGVVAIYEVALFPLVALACVAALAIVWRYWVSPIGRATGPPAPRSWTENVSLTLAITWPLQLGFALMLAG